METYKHVLGDTIKKYGQDAQVEKIGEECLELALAIRHFYCPTKDEDINAVIDEVADVKIMLAQADIIFGEDRINERVKAKMQRLVDKHL